MTGARADRIRLGGSWSFSLRKSFFRRRDKLHQRIGGAWGKYRDGLGWGFVGPEHLKITRSVTPAGAEMMAICSGVGPCEAAGTEALGGDLKGDGSDAEHVAVPIYQRAFRLGDDLDLDGLGDSFGSAGDGLGLRSGAGCQEEGGK